MKSLSGLDATFLYIESAETPMHVGSLHLYELPKGFKGSFHKAVLAHIAQRLHLAPIFTRRLSFMPLDMGHPGWIEADAVRLTDHISKVKGRSFSFCEVQTEVARLHGMLMDRSRPLWEFHIFENVQPPPGATHAGKLIAFYAKIHHAALDGKGGALFANAILDLSATPRKVPAPDNDLPQAVAEPDTRTLVGAVLSNSLTQYVKLLRSLPVAASSLGSALAQEVLGRRNSDSGKPGTFSRFSLAPRTLFNVAITPERSIATLSLSFAECRTLAHDVGGSFNDMIMWLCATALRGYLAGHGGIPRKSLVAAMPVSLRDEGNQELNTQATMLLVDLGTRFANPVQRMAAIQASTARVKEAVSHLKSVLPTDYPSLLAPWLVGGVTKAAYKVYSATGLDKYLPMPANVIISNVPGPQVPLYLAGARMLTYYPLSAVTHSVALNITVQTYAGSVDFGLVADKHAIPDLQKLADALNEAFVQARTLLSKASAPAATKAPAGQSGPKRRVAKVTKFKGAATKATADRANRTGKAATVKTV